MILTVIVACEIGFWLLVGLGLLARYALNLRRVGITLLAMTPVVDLVLLTAVLISLSNGETATVFHGMAAVYLGASVAYGHKMISWADHRVAHRYGRGRAVGKLYGTAYMKACWQDVARTTIAVSIAAGIIWLLVALVDDPNRTDALLSIYGIIGLWFTLDLVWAVGYTISPRKRPASMA